MTSFYRIQDQDRDPQALLDPANWVSITWTETRIICADCDGAGCPRCDFDGEISEQPRRGVSASRSLHELASYMEQAWGDVRGTVIIEMEGDVSGDDDFDAKAGALLVLPSRIISVTPVAGVTELAAVLARDEAAR